MTSLSATQKYSKKIIFSKHFLNSRVYGFDLKENAIVLVCCVETPLEQPVMTGIIFPFAILLPPGRSKTSGGGMW